MKLTPSQKQYVRRRLAHEDPSELGGELNIIPFLDIVVNLIMFLLVTVISAVAVSQVAAQLPAYGRCTGSGCGERALDLSVTLTESGIYVAGSGDILGAQCGAGSSTSGSATVAGGDYDGLSACLRQIKERYPDEDTVTLSADPLVPYAELIRAMDAARTDDRGVLFPEVLIAAGVR